MSNKTGPSHWDLLHVSMRLTRASTFSLLSGTVFVFSLLECMDFVASFWYTFTWHYLVHFFAAVVYFYMTLSYAFFAAVVSDVLCVIFCFWMKMGHMLSHRFSVGTCFFVLVHLGRDFQKICELTQTKRRSWTACQDVNCSNAFRRTNYRLFFHSWWSQLRVRLLNILSFGCSNFQGDASHLAYLVHSSEENNLKMKGGSTWGVHNWGKPSDNMSENQSLPDLMYLKAFCPTRH